MNPVKLYVRSESAWLYEAAPEFGFEVEVGPPPEPDPAILEAIALRRERATDDRYEAAPPETQNPLPKKQKPTGPNIAALALDAMNRPLERRKP